MKEPYDWASDEEMVLTYKESIIEMNELSKTYDQKEPMPEYRCLCGSACQPGKCYNVPC
jgi:hypothetical protein